MITLLVGLPGSGKSHLGQRLSEATGRPFFDDATDLPDTAPFILTHPAFCDDAVRALVLARINARWPNTPVEVLCFANDPDAATRNAATRPNKRVNGLIIHLSKNYTPTEPILPVWSPPSPS